MRNLFFIVILCLSFVGLQAQKNIFRTAIDTSSNRSIQPEVTLTVPIEYDDNNHTFHWSTGDTTSSIKFLMPDSTTLYSVKITAQDGGQIELTISSDCFLNLTVTPNSICWPDSASMFVTNNVGIVLPTGGDYDFYWSDNLPNTNTATRKFSPTVTTTYSVTVTHSSGCGTSMSRTVVVNPAIPVYIQGPSQVCEGQSATYKVVDQFGNPISNAGYWWSTGTENTNSVTVTINQPTIISVTVTQGGCSSYATKTIGVFPKPVIVIEQFKGLGQTTLLAYSSGSFLWGNGSKNQFLKVNQPGWYMVTVTDQNGCTNSASVDVTGFFACPPSDTFLVVETITLEAEVPAYVPYPVSIDTCYEHSDCPDYSGITANVGNGIVCEDTYLFLTPPIANSYEWSNGSQDRIFVVNTNVPGVRLYSCVINGNEQLFFQVIVYSESLPKPIVATVGGGDVFCDSTTLAVDQIDTNFVYQWYRNDVAILGATKPTVKVGLSGDYSVSVETPCSRKVSDGTWVTIVDCGGTTGLQDGDVEDDFNVYPNPSSGVFYVDMPNEGGVQYVLYDLQGEIVMQGTANDDFEIEGLHLPAGPYVLQVITTKAELFTEKVIIQ